MKSPHKPTNPQDHNSKIVPTEETTHTITDRGLAFGKRIFSSLENPQFRFYYAAVLVQSPTMNMQLIARSLLIYRITDSATIVGFLSLAFALPLLIFTYYGGSLADRYPKRTVMRIGYFSNAMVAILIAVIIRTGYLGSDNSGSWWILMATAAIQGFILAVTMPAQSSIIPELVPPEQVQNSVALNSFAMEGMRIFGPAITGFVIEFSGFETVYFITGGLYFSSWLIMWFLPKMKRSTVKTESTLRSLKEGISYLRRDVTIMLILVVALFVFLLGQPCYTMLPIFSDDVLKVGASGMGILYSVSGIGATIASLFMAWWPPKHRGKIFLWTILLMSFSIVGFSFSTIWYLSLVMIAVMGFTSTLFGTTVTSLLLNYSLEEQRGRIMSLFMMQNGLISLGATIAGVITDSIDSVQWAIGCMAMGLAAVALFALFKLKRIWVLN